MSSHASLSLPVEPLNLLHARVVGARTGMILAAIMGSALAALASEEAAVCLSVVSVTALVIVAARPLGAWVGAGSLGRHALRGVARGVAGALACLLIAALGASVVGCIWYLGEGAESAPFFSRYVLAPFALVGLYGAPFATVLGALHGLVVHCLLRWKYAPAN